MSPVPEKKSGSWGVSMRKRRGLWSEVAVEPIIVRFSTSAMSISGFASAGAADVVVGAVCVVEGLCVRVPAFETGREGMVWLSRVRRSDVMITCGTW